MGTREATWRRQADLAFDALRRHSQNPDIDPTDRNTFPPPATGLRLREPVVRLIWDRLIQERLAHDTDASWARAERLLNDWSFTSIYRSANGFNLPDLPRTMEIAGKEPQPLLNRLEQTLTFATSRRSSAEASPGPFGMRFFWRELNPALIVSSKFNEEDIAHFLCDSPSTKEEHLREFAERYPHRTHLLLNADAYPLEGLPWVRHGTPIVAMPSTNPRQLATAWLAGEKEWTATSDDRPIKWAATSHLNTIKATYRGLGELVPADRFWEVADQLQDMHRDRTLVFFEGVMNRTEPLPPGDLAAFIAMAKTHHGLPPHENWWNWMMTCRSALSLDEVEMLLLHAPDSMTEHQERHLSAWLAEDGELTLGDEELDTLPADLRWDILKNR